MNWNTARAVRSGRSWKRRGTEFGKRWRNWKVSRAWRRSREIKKINLSVMSSSPRVTLIYGQRYFNVRLNTAGSLRNYTRKRKALKKYFGSLQWKVKIFNAQFPIFNQ